MKKALSLLLALILCLSLCACGESTKEDEMTAEIEGGTYATSEKRDGVDGSVYNQSFLEFYKGGVGRSYTITRRITQEEGREVNASSFTWRIEDEYLKITTGSGYERIFSIGVSGGTLTDIANNTLYNHQPKAN